MKVGISKAALKCFLPHGTPPPIAAYTMRAYRENSRKAVRELLIVATLFEQGDQRRLRFDPGSTGHEEYLFNEAFVEKVKGLPIYSDKVSIFGGFEYAKFYLCAGSASYDALWVLVKDMKELVEFMVQAQVGEVEEAPLTCICARCAKYDGCPQTYDKAGDGICLDCRTNTNHRGHTPTGKTLTGGPCLDPDKMHGAGDDGGFPR